MPTDSASRPLSWRDRGRLAWWATLLLGIALAIMPPLYALASSSRQVVAKGPSPLEIAACLLLAALLLELGTAYLVSRREKLVQKRVARGECVGCGYPNSGSTDRCSECGLQLGSRPRAKAGISSFAIVARGFSIAVVATAVFHVVVPLPYAFTTPSTLSSSFSVNGGPTISIRVEEGGWAYRGLVGTSAIPADECAPINDVTFVNESSQATTRRTLMMTAAGRWVVTPGGFTLEDNIARLGAELDQELGMSVNMDGVSLFVRGTSGFFDLRSISTSNGTPSPRGILVPVGFQVPIRPTFASVMWLLGVGTTSFAIAIFAIVRGAKRRET